MDISSIYDSKPGKNGEKYILILTDVFSSFCLLRALKDKTAHSVAEALWHIFNDFGPPRYIQSDGAAEFISAVVADLISSFGSKHRTIPAYNPRSAGKVERNVGVATTTLRKLLTGESPHSWPDMLPLAQNFMNTKHHNLTNSSPVALVFNRTCNNYQSYTNINFDQITPEDYAAWLHHEQKLHELI